MTPREEFALYLEMAGSVEARARLSALHGKDFPSRMHTYWSGHGIITVGTARDTVEAALGSPDAAGRGFLAYRLPEWPGYRYRFAFNPDTAQLMWSGFEREGPVPSPPPVPCVAEAWPAFAATLGSMGATEAELVAWLGEPQDTFGWWPDDVWVYPLGKLGLRHGVVEDFQKKER